MPKTPPPQPPGAAIDPLTFARFLVLPRATELLEAFAAIPPGRLRDTIVEHAHALAEAHQSAPPQYRAPDPLPAALGLPEAPRALPRRSNAEPPAGTPKTRAVKMRLDGKHIHEIVKATALTPHQVYDAIGEARKAGVKFPPGRAPRGQGVVKAQTFAMSVEEAVTSGHPSAVSSASRAAEARGISMEAYFARRKLAITMAMDERHIRAIMEATREGKTTLAQWFSMARSVGHPIPFMMDGVPEKKPNVVKLSSARTENRVFVLNDADTGPKGRALVDKAAAALGLDRPGYYELRARALTLFRSGKPPVEVASLLKLSPKQASNWKDRAVAAGLLKRQA
jgi:hypothetical protein